VRLSPKGDSLKIADYAIVPDDDTLFARMYRAATQLARQRSLARIGGWLPNIPAARELFHLQPRGREVTMIKSLCAEAELDDASLAAADRFCEIDHV
jgi:hypothetical protein